MLRPRVIPVLTLAGEQMVKTLQFSNPIYLGDPFNAVRIFNTKEVDELVILDITATAECREPDPAFIADLASECFMPVSFGGAIESVEVAGQVLAAGVEKVVANTALLRRPSLADELVAEFGSQAVVASVDVGNRRLRGARVAMTDRGVSFTARAPEAWLQELAQRGVGEVLLTSVDRDGTGNGYDLALLEKCAASVHIPMLACGGAASVADLRAALEVGAAGAAAGRMFVTHGRHRAALISYPSPQEIEELNR